MSISLLVFILTFAWLTLMSLQRPIYGVALYFLTYFGDPVAWWWGEPLISLRINLFAALVATGSVLLHSQFKFRKLSDAWLEILLALIVLNATFVHFGLAERQAISLKAYDLAIKFAVLTFLIKHAIKSKADLFILMIVLTIAVGHIGWEVKMNDAGSMIGGRLELVGPPTANSSNQLASLLVAVLPLLGTLALVAGRWQRLIAVAAAPFAVNTLLLCNSRGAFLGALVSAGVYIALAPPKARRIALTIVALGVTGTVLLARDEKIYNRFLTTFVKAEERDTSASSRLDYWKAGLRMVQDYPFGSGGDGYKKVHGHKYRAVFGHNEDIRSVHNGFINEACEWGVQGLFLRVCIYFIAVIKAVMLARQLSRQGDPKLGLVASAVASGTAAFLVTAVFGDHFDNEWGLWLVGISASLEPLLMSGEIGNAATQLVWYRLIPVQAAVPPAPEPFYRSR